MFDRLFSFERASGIARQDRIADEFAAHQNERAFVAESPVLPDGAQEGTRTPTPFGGRT